MTYREFSVLCAIYSAIGAAHHPVAITRDTARARAMGYKAASMLFNDRNELTPAGKRLLAERQDKAHPLTVDQVRYTLDTLEAKNLFARCQPSGRIVYFSNRMPRDEMRKRLLSWKTRRNFELRKERDADRELQRKIKETNDTNTRPLSPDSPPIPRFNSQEEQNGQAENSPQAVPGESPPDSPPSPHGVPAITETDLTETVLTETFPTETAVAHACFSEKKASPRNQGFQPPQTIEEVVAFACRIQKAPSNASCKRWWDDNYGKDWTAKDWKQDVARFLLDRKRVALERELTT